MPGQQGDLFDYAAELRRYHEHLRAAIDVRPADHVLDIGCGTGQTTRESGKGGGLRKRTGIDVSAPRLARARRLSHQEGLRNVTFVQADAQTHRFPPECFDLAISRFGTMFFADPLAAFTSIGRALRPGARLPVLPGDIKKLGELSKPGQRGFAVNSEVVLAARLVCTYPVGIHTSAGLIGDTSSRHVTETSPSGYRYSQASPGCLARSGPS